MAQFTKYNNPNKRRYKKPYRHSKKYTEEMYLEMIKATNGEITENDLKAYDITINP